jgi:hypothetical protein
MTKREEYNEELHARLLQIEFETVVAEFMMLDAGAGGDYLRSGPTPHWHGLLLPLTGWWRQEYSLGRTFLTVGRVPCGPAGCWIDQENRNGKRLPILNTESNPQRTVVPELLDSVG